VTAGPDIGKQITHVIAVGTGGEFIEHVEVILTG
jgi:hypothetical protein